MISLEQAIELRDEIESAKHEFNAAHDVLTGRDTHPLARVGEPQDAFTNLIVQQMDVVWRDLHHLSSLLHNYAIDRKMDEVNSTCDEMGCENVIADADGYYGHNVDWLRGQVFCSDCANAHVADAKDSNFVR